MLHDRVGETFGEEKKDRQGRQKVLILTTKECKKCKWRTQII
jgi:hypothetical protein